MKEDSYPIIFALVMLLAVGFIGTSVDAVPATQTSTSTATATTMTSITVTVTTTSTQNSLTTSTSLSTLTQGSQTVVTSVTNTSYTTSSTTTLVTETPNTPTVTTTAASPQSTPILGNPPGVLLIVITSLIALALVGAPRILTSRKRGIICENCGYENPPFAAAYCINCGRPYGRN